MSRMRQVSRPKESQMSHAPTPKSHAWVTNQSQMTHEWVMDESFHDCGLVTNGSYLPPQRVTNELEMRSEWVWILDESRMCHISCTHKSQISRDYEWVTKESCLSMIMNESHERVMSPAPKSHQWVTNDLQMSYERVSNPSRTSNEWVTNASRMSHERVTSWLWISHEWVTSPAPKSHEWVTN